MTYLARVEYELDGETDDFAIPFPYLVEENLFVFWTPVGGIKQAILTGFELTSPSVMHFTSLPGTSGVLMIRRFTYDDDLLDRLQAPSTLSAAELNTIAVQLLYLIQEALDAGLSVESENLVTLLGALVDDLRWSYDVSLIGADTFFNGERIGPVPLARAVYLPEDAVGSSAKTYAPPDVQPHIVSIRKNNVEVGTITVAHEDPWAVTIAVAADVEFEVGDDVSLVTTQDGGMTEFGCTLRFRRTI